MADEKDQKPDPVLGMFAIDDEAERAAVKDDAELNVDPPEDKKPPERDEAGKFKGSDEKKPDAKKPDDKKADAKAEDKPAETVPLAKFLEKTNALKEQLDAKDITLKQYEQRLAALEAKAAPKSEEPAEPDYVEDPKGYVDHKLNAALKGIEAANKAATESGKKVEETTAAIREREQLNQMMGSVAETERAFVSQTPDYYDALAHIRGIRAFQLQEFNPQITPEQIRQAIQHEETQLAITLMRQGKNPSDVAYRLAQQFGYVPKTKPQAETKPDGEQPKLPEVQNKRLPPDQTLGTGSSPGDAEVYKPGEVDPVDTALSSLFGKRKTG